MNENSQATTALLDKNARIEMAQKFFDELYSRVEGYYFTYLWIQREKDGNKERKTIPFLTHDAEDRAKMATRAIALNDDGWQVYFGVHLTEKTFKANERAHTEDIVAQAAVIADIDIESPWHVSSDKKLYPPDIETAKSFLPFEPSILVDSGGGIHAYFGIITDYGTSVRFYGDDEKRKSVEARNKKLIECIRQRAGKYAGAVDSVFDLPRVFRVPGTYNLKNGREGAPLCKVISYGDRDYPIDFFDSQLEDFFSTSTASEATTSETFADVHNLEEMNMAETPIADSKSDDANADYEDDPPEYERARILAMLDAIDVGALNDTDWLAVISAAKNLGVDYGTVDAFNRRDPERYDEKENQTRWDSLNNPSFGIETLHGIAKRFGYSEHDFKKQWYQENPQFSKKQHRPSRRKPIPAEKDSALTLTAQQKKDLFCGDTFDLDYSERLIYLYKNQIRYISDAEKWIHYSGGAWNFNDTRNSSIYPLAIRAANAMIAAATNDHERKIASTFRQQKKITAAVILLKGFSNIIIRQKDLDKNPMLLNVANGVIDLETGKLMPAAPELLLTKQSPAIYDPNYYSSVFDDFMIQILPDEQTRTAVLRFLGYCLTGDVRAEKALFIHGGGRNGKGVLLRSIMKVLADYAVPLNIDALLQHRTEKDGDSPTPEFAKLEGIRMAFANEIPQGKNLDAAHFKDLTGGDSIAIRRLHQESSIIENPTHKLILCGQHLPDLRDSKDTGLQERLMVVKFTETFTGEKCDPNLKYRLTEPDALTGILTVLVRECLAWQRDGLISSTAMEQEKKSYLESNDFITDFIAEFCERGGDEKSIARADFLSRLKNAYPQARAIGDRGLTEMIKKVDGISYRRSNGARKFFGVEWKDDQQG